MPQRPILSLLLAGLAALLGLLSSVSWPLNPEPLRLNLGPWSLNPPAAHADGPGGWPMFRHDPAHSGYNP